MKNEVDRYAAAGAAECAAALLSINLFFDNGFEYVQQWKQQLQQQQQQHLFSFHVPLSCFILIFGLRYFICTNVKLLFEGIVFQNQQL